jgi:nicotinate-nucleotide pyrophosphorylase (carboxylating)
MSGVYNSSLPALLIKEAVQGALKEDLGLAGDITSQATIPPEAQAKAVLRSRQNGVLVGLPLARQAFLELDGDFVFKPKMQDGDALEKDSIIAELSGNARALLSAERVALNYLTHLSGIASATKQFADQIAHTKARITCTRKTLPGLRAYQKYAVKLGGGSNHRYGLDDAILIKDNHIAVAGGVGQALQAAKAFAGHLVKIELEVDTLDQLSTALASSAKPDVVLLDNMSLDDLRNAVKLAEGQVILEASGNVRLETVKSIAQTGVNYISSGWITNSAPSIDIGLDIEINT